LGGVDQATDRLFRRALEAAAKALRDLDAKQVPADLRRVAGRPLPLPPPLAASLLKGIDRYDWLREKALEAWPEADAKASGPEQASALLLRRPPGWATRVVNLAVGVGGEAAREAGDDLGHRLETAQAEAEEWKRRARAEKEQGRREVREAKGLLASERLARKVLQAAPARVEAVRDAEVAGLSAEVRERVSERDAARDASRRLKEALAEERRRRAAAEAELAEAGGSASWAGDPVSLAAHLDWSAGMARPPAPTAAGSAGGEEAVLRLPEGVRPDQKAAVDWLVQRSEATTLIVDGYNAAFRLTASRDPAVGRKRVLMVLDRLRRVARGPVRVVAVFDSGLGPAAGEPPPGPVEVRFTVGAGRADADIAALAAGTAGARVVLSSDREVREAADAAGALALWSEALCDWWKRR
jgi:hypothetical protein